MGSGEGISPQKISVLKAYRRGPRGRTRGGSSPSLPLLPRFMGLSTDSLSLSTKLINSLRAQPDKLLINWLHCPPPRTASGPSLPSLQHNAQQRFLVPSFSRALGDDPGFLTPQGDLVMVTPVFLLCTFLGIFSLLIMGWLWSDRTAHTLSPASFCSTAGGGGLSGPIISPH